jgi:hypothetical protein
MQLQSLRQEHEHELQRMKELCMPARRTPCRKQQLAIGIHSPSEEEESARRTERIQQLCAQIGDMLLAEIRDLQG